MIDDGDRKAAADVLATCGWPSRSRAVGWLAEVLRAGANQAQRLVEEEREACARASG